MASSDMPVVRAHGAAIPALGFGTSGSTDADWGTVVAQALRAGHRHIDTARNYGSEEGVGEGIRASGVARAEIFLVTKVPRENHAPDLFARSVEASLKALGVDYVDLLHVHWPLPGMDMKAVMGALAKARREGLARHLGVANFNIALLQQAMAPCPEPLVTLQAEYHPFLDQRKVLAFCRANGLAFTAYCPLARRRVFGDPVLERIASTHGRSVAQVALRWLVQQDGVVPIPGSSNPQRLRENLAIFDFALSEDEMRDIHALARPDGRIANPKGRAPVWD
jgi:diketogulonate reductase-like aldo/keto reductase